MLGWQLNLVARDIDIADASQPGGETKMPQSIIGPPKLRCGHAAGEKIGKNSKAAIDKVDLLIDHAKIELDCIPVVNGMQGFFA